MQRMEITLNSPLDMHLHLRDGNMLKLTAPLSADFAGAVIMPNLVPPVTTPEQMQAYAGRISAAMDGAAFTPYMTLFFTPLGEAELLAARETPGFFGFKLYPAGITTNSEGGVSDMAQADTTLRLMEELGIPLLVHGESHGFVMDREQEFLAVYRHLATKYPRLKLSMEHITTAAALQLLDEFPNVCATVTLQHLIITLDDVANDIDIDISPEHEDLVPLCMAYYIWLEDEPNKAAFFLARFNEAAALARQVHKRPGSDAVISYNGW